MRIDQSLVLIALVTGFLLSSCATMTPDECKYANWHQVGESDGRVGKPISMLDSRRKDCAEAHLTVDTFSYSAGRELGLRNYCRLENAVQVGLDGETYHGVCPAPIDGEFRRRVAIGAAVHELRSGVSNLEGRIESTERRQRGLDREEEKSLKDVTKDDERRRIRREFDGKRNDVRDDLHDLDRKLRHARERLRDAEHALGSMR